jgi:hypothetical protein
VLVDADGVETKDESGSQYISFRIGPVFGLKDAKLGELSDALGSRPRAPCDLILGEPVSCHVTYEVGSALKAS